MDAFQTLRALRTVSAANITRHRCHRWEKNQPLEAEPPAMIFGLDEGRGEAIPVGAASVNQPAFCLYLTVSYGASLNRQLCLRAYGTF
jgi:hypothetical protein